MTVPPEALGKARSASDTLSVTRRYRYRAVDRSGNIVAGLVDASSSQAVLLELERTAMMPIEISDEHEDRASFWPLFSQVPRREEVTGLTRDLAMLIEGGISLDRALLILSETGVRSVIARLMQSLHSAITAGKKFAEALSAHPAAFPPAYVKMVEVAEASGTLSQTLDLIAHQRSRSEKLKQRMSSALIYPTFLVVTSAGVLIFVLTFIIPEFERSLAGFQDEFDRSAQTVFALSRLLRDNAGWISFLAVALLAASLFGARNRTIRKSFFQVLMVLPGLRAAVKHERTVVICSTLGTLMSSGVDISSALRLVRDLMRDKKSSEKLDRTLRGVRQGRRLSDMLFEVDIVPAYASHMIRVGEESGKTAESTIRIAEIYEQKLDRELGRITAIIGPAVLILVSVMIAWIIVSVMTALLGVNDLLLTGGDANVSVGLA